MGFLDMGWEGHDLQTKQGIIVYGWDIVMGQLQNALSQQNQLADQLNYPYQAQTNPRQVFANQIVQYPLQQTTDRENLESPNAPKLDPIRMNPGSVRVPLYHDDANGLYIIWTGDSALRRLTAEMLPDCVKFKLGIINACPETQEAAAVDAAFIDHLELFIITPIDKLRDVGWRASKYYYCLIMTEAQLEEVKGTVVEGIT